MREASRRSVGDRLHLAVRALPAPVTVMSVMRRSRARSSWRRWLGWPASVALIGLLAMHGWSAVHEGRALQHLRTATVSAPVVAVPGVVGAEAMASSVVTAGRVLLAGPAEHRTVQGAERLGAAGDRSFPLGVCLAVLAVAVLLLAAAAGWPGRRLGMAGRRHWPWLPSATPRTSHSNPSRPLLTRLCVSRT